VKIAPTAQVNNSRSRSGRICATNKIATYAATNHVATPNAFSQKIGVKKAIHLSAALEWRSSGHRFDVEIGIIEQRKVNLPAHVGNVSLVEQQLGCTPPALATLCLLVRQ
jgi:hypothetical protein